MKQVILENYSDPSKLCLFDVEQGNCQQIEKQKQGLPPEKPSGFYSIRTLGLIPGSREVVAVFCEEDTLVLYMSGRLHNLSREDCHVRLRYLLPGVKRFMLYTNGRPSSSFRYWITADCGEGPGDGDIFSYLESITKDAQSKTAALRVLQAWHLGKDMKSPHFESEITRQRGHADNNG